MQHLSPLMAELRRRGARGTIYIDDNWTAGKTYEECLYWESQTKELFSKAGWVFKPGKRSGNPAQVCRFLGLDLDSRDLTFNIPEDKLQKIESKATELLKRKFNKVQSIASFVGLLQSVRLATGPIVSILTRSLYHLIIVQGIGAVLSVSTIWQSLRFLGGSRTLDQFANSP